jgi:hypothetical protein
VKSQVTRGERGTVSLIVESCTEHWRRKDFHSNARKRNETQTLKLKGSDIANRFSNEKSIWQRMPLRQKDAAG